jgi:hypothetical protein
VRRSFPILLALCAACSQEPTPVSASVSVIDSDQKVTLTLEQTRIEVAPEVRYVLSAISTEPGVMTSAGTLDGHPFGLRRGEFFIGPESYGQPPAGTTVYVRHEGVFFGEEQRGELPAPLPAAK